MSVGLQSALAILVDVFQRYSSNEGDKYTLNRSEMKTLLQKELPEFLAASNDPNAVEKFMFDLDENKDGEVDFQEFMVLVAALTMACHEFFVKMAKN